MTEGARILWCFAIDSGSRMLDVNDLAPALSTLVNECHSLDSNDSSKIVTRLRLAKRMRSAPIILSLRELLEDGRIQRAWIERQDGAERVRIADGQMLQFEPIVAKKKKTKKPTAETHGKKHATLPPGAKKQKKSAAEEEMPKGGGQGELDNADEDNEDEDGEEEEEENDDDDDDEEEESSGEINAILSTIDRLTSTLGVLKRKVVVLLKKRNKGKRSEESTSEDDAPKIPKLSLPSHIKRQPVRLSWLRTATVSELYFAGVWFPNHDVDDTIKSAPPRDACFRSELPQGAEYIENFDIDDLLHPDLTNPYLTNRAAALKVTGKFHFVNQCHRGAVVLRALRTSAYDVLHQLGVFFLDYDIDDENPQPQRPERGRLTRTQINDKWKFHTQYMDWEFKFIKGYDINDIDAQTKVNYIHGAALEWKEEHNKSREALRTDKPKPEVVWVPGQIVKSIASQRRAAKQNNPDQ
jgi:hypothetical protein